MILLTIFIILMIAIFGGLLGLGITLAWSIPLLILAIVFCPIILIILAICGLLIIAFPILIVVGIILLIVKLVRRH